MTDKKNLGKLMTQIGNIFESAKQGIRSGSNEAALNLLKGSPNEFENVQEFFTVKYFIIFRQLFYTEILKCSSIF